MTNPYLISILTGIIFGTSYIPFLPWAIFICYVPLWVQWLKAKSVRSVFWTGWWVQFIFTLIGFNWVAHTVHEFGHLPWPIAVIVLLLFAGFASLYVPLVGVVWFWFSHKLNLRQEARIWALPVMMSLGERLFPMIFDWNFGYTWLWAKFPAAHLADIVGFMGLSTIGLLFNGLVLYAWWRSRESRIWWPSLAAVPVLFLALNIWGHFHQQQLPPPDAEAKFLVVQANIGNEEKIQAERGSRFREIVIDQFAQLTRDGLEKFGPVDFVVWPETAFPEIIDRPDMQFGYPNRLRQFIATIQTKLITGGYSLLEGTRQVTNSFVVLNEQGLWAAPPYHKTMLLAFGEYFPGANLLPQVKKWFPDVGDFGRGPGPTVLQVGDFKIGAQICYEGLFDHFSRALANQGAQVIVNLTNDSWYDLTFEPNQHLYMTLARTIETRRPMVRATNTGISAAILADGTILGKSAQNQPWVHAFQVAYHQNPPTTIFMKWGFWLLPVVLVLAIALIAWRGRPTDAK